MTTAYDAWMAAKAALAGREIAEGLRSALELSVAALREPAKLAVVEGWLSKHKAHLEDLIDEHDDGYRMEDIAPAIVRALEEFEDSGPALIDQRKELAERVDNALRAMKHLNYTGEHTHFEVLDDVRTVLAEVVQGRAIPELERFRCPSLREVKRDVAADTSAGQLQCTQQLPHPGPHCSGSYSWDDEHSINPPKSYDEPEIALVDKIGVREDGTGAHCGVLATVDGKTVACMEPIDSDHSVHRSVGGRLYRIRPSFTAEGGV